MLIVYCFSRIFAIRFFVIASVIIFFFRLLSLDDNALMQSACLLQDENNAQVQGAYLLAYIFS